MSCTIDPNLTLVAAVGLSPQVVTETLYALYREGTLPGEIHLITTTDGRTQIKTHLLNPHHGAFYRFCADYDIDSRRIRFDIDTIHVLINEHGDMIDDMRSNDDSCMAADQVVALLRKLSMQPARRLHVSV